MSFESLLKTLQLEVFVNVQLPTPQCPVSLVIPRSEVNSSSLSQPHTQRPVALFLNYHHTFQCL